MTDPRPPGDTMIRLEELTKRYPGQSEPAVDAISLDVPAGEVVVFVGPSGCGKTTTLKMINRIIEPTSGRIVLDGEDVTRIDADRLRRRIGYVIQQVGLFPHKTVADNVGVVPGLLGWSRTRVRERVDELLDLVGLEPSEFRSRYPKELSGGQRQRVGVARAMGGDPPVMLMDEPFGAIDPITRARLQDELLRIQDDVRKTIVFVTHDIDEAIKMGDRIAILSDRSHIAQYDTPEAILTAPADAFVEDFIGSGAALKRLGLTRVGDVALAQPITVGADEPPEALARRLADGDGGPGSAVLVVDGDGRPERWATAGDPGGAAGQVPAGHVATVRAEATLRDALDAMVTSTVGRVVVVDADGSCRGTVDIATVTRVVDEMRAAALVAGGGDGDGDGDGRPDAEPSEDDTGAVA
jgi:osmoprotectant transport system ATP-binding protein